MILEIKTHKIMKEILERYALLCKDIKHQIDFIGDYYAMDFEHLQQTINEVKELQEKIRQNQKAKSSI